MKWAKGGPALRRAGRRRARLGGRLERNTGLKGLGMHTASRPTTVLGEGTRIDGDLELDHDVVFHGTLTGRLRVRGAVEVGPSATVRGGVGGRSVRIAGRVEGDIAADDVAELLTGARVEGVIYAARLVVGEGVEHDGRVCIHPEASRRAESIRDEDRDEPSSDPSADLFAPIPGTVNAGIRPRRRVPMPPLL